MSGYPDFERLANEPQIDTRQVQEFLDWFDCFEWAEIDTEDQIDIQRAMKLKEAVTGDSATDQDFEVGNVVLVRENAFTEYIKSEEIELNSSAWKEMPRVWQDNINWGEVAQELRSEYAEIEWEGNTYLYDTSRL